MPERVVVEVVAIEQLPVSKRVPPRDRELERRKPG